MARVLAVGLGLSSGQAAAEIAFADRSADLPAAHVYDGGWTHFVGGGVAVLDCDADGFADLFAAGGSNPARLFRNRSQPGGAVTFIPGELPEILSVTGAYPLDVNSDGLLDLVVLRNGENLLLQGQGDCAFTPAPASWGFDGGAEWTTAFSATFEPGQDWPTLAFGNYVDQSDPDGPFEACDTNYLMRPNGKAFAPRTALSPGHCALSMLISDWQRNGTPDLRISNDRQYYVRDGREQMWRLDPLAEYGAAEGWPDMKLWGMGIASRDLTGDGLPEVVLTSMGDQPLQINQGGGVMKNAPYAIGSYATTPYIGDDGRPSTGWHAAFGDVNNDGRDDLFIAKGNVDQMPSNAIHDPNNLLIQQPDGRFIEMGAVTGIGTTERARRGAGRPQPRRAAGYRGHEPARPDGGLAEHFGHRRPLAGARSAPSGGQHARRRRNRRNAPAGRAHPDTGKHRGRRPCLGHGGAVAFRAGRGRYCRGPGDLAGWPDVRLDRGGCRPDPCPSARTRPRAPGWRELR